MAKTRAAVRVELGGYVRPLQEGLDALTAELDVRLAEISRLAKLRDDVAEALRLLNGDRPSEAKPKAEKRGSLADQVSPKAIEKMLAWMIESEARFPDGFTTAGLSQSSDVPVKSESYRSAVLSRMHNDGLLRLDRKDVGGRRYFKLTELAPLLQTG